MRLCLLGHHGKEQYLGAALQAWGFEFVAPNEPHDVLLVDSDHPHAVPYPAKHDLVKRAVRLGIPVVLYPHGAPPDLDMDGLRRSSIPVACQLVHGEGHVEVARRFGSTRRMEVVGWSYGPMAEPHAKPVEHLVFAPVHPWANGHDILPYYKALNQIAYQLFLQHPAPEKTVRMWGADKPNGITSREPFVQYEQSDLGSGVELIDTADAVLSFGTFAYQALARGKPTVMIDGLPGTTSDDGKNHAQHLDDYRDYLRYPASMQDGPLDELFARDVSEWKRLFVGEPLDGEKVAAVLRSLRPNRATRRRMARA